MYLQQIAQQVVDNLMEVIDYRTINIIDVSGIIIASGDKKRIGSYHKGGDDVLKYGKTIEITSENVDQYVGAKEGVNMPINIEGKLIGVVGVFGQPDEVRMIAKLIKNSVELAFKQYVISSQVKLATDLKHQLIRILIYENIEEKEEEILCLAKVTGVDLTLNRYAIVFEECSSTGNPNPESIQRSSYYISSMNVLGEGDFASLLGNNYVLFIKDITRLEKNLEAIKAESNLKLGIGTSRSGVIGYKKSFLEAKECLSIEAEKCVNMNDLTTQSKYLFNKINKEMLEYYIKPLYLSVIDEEGSLPHWFIDTVRELLKYNLNISAASEALFIHKNTLTYRIKKVESLTGLSFSNNFYHIALLEMLLVYINNKH